MYTVDEVAERLRVNRRTVLRLISDGEIEARRIGRQWRIPDSALNDLLGRDRGGAGPSAGFRRSDDAVAAAGTTAGRAAEVHATAIVDVEPVSRDEADRKAQSILAAIRSREFDGVHSRCDYLYDEDASRCRFVLFGSPALMRDFFSLISRVTD